MTPNFGDLLQCDDLEMYNKHTDGQRLEVSHISKGF